MPDNKSKRKGRWASWVENMMLRLGYRRETDDERALRRDREQAKRERTVMRSVNRVHRELLLMTPPNEGTRKER